jgi:hypothetical protein
MDVLDAELAGKLRIFRMTTPATSVLAAFSAGIKLTMRVKTYLLVAWIASLVLSLIPAVSIYQSVEASLGASQSGENMLKGYDDTWYRTFAQGAHGLDATFTPSVAGVGPVLDGLETLIGSNGFSRVRPSLFGFGALYFLVWVFFSGGFIASFARKPEDEPDFLRQAAANFPRLLVLGVLSLALYWLLFAKLAPVVYGWTRSMVAISLNDKTHFQAILGAAALTWAIAAILHLILDYSKILTVVLRASSPLLLPVRATRLVFRNFPKTLGLYALLGLTWLIPIVLYEMVAPGVGQSSGPAIIAAFAAGQVLILLRVWIRCLFYGAQTSLYLALTGRE